MPDSILIDSQDTLTDEQDYRAPQRSFVEYTEFDFVDADQQHNQPLLAQTSESDEESSLDLMEPKQYKLPSEGGTIFSSFVRAFF
jgi:hypothetical protein